MPTGIPRLITSVTGTGAEPILCFSRAACESKPVRKKKGHGWPSASLNHQNRVANSAEFCLCKRHGASNRRVQSILTNSCHYSAGQLSERCSCPLESHCLCTVATKPVPHSSQINSRFCKAVRCLHTWQRCHCQQPICLQARPRQLL